MTDPFLHKVEEWVEASKGRIRADVAHDKLAALGYGGSERSPRRAVAAVKAAYRLGHVRVHRPWVTEPEMWLQYDFGDCGSGARSGCLHFGETSCHNRNHKLDRATLFGQHGYLSAQLTGSSTRSAV